MAIYLVRAAFNLQLNQRFLLVSHYLVEILESMLRAVVLRPADYQLVIHHYLAFNLLNLNIADFNAS